MRFKVDHDLHIHSHLSSCSKDPNQTTERILQYAKDNGLSRICITDHYWDTAAGYVSSWYEPQNFEHISKSLPLPKADGIDFMFGCETDMDMNMRIGIPPERYDDFGFIIIPTTHMHMKFAVAEEDRESNKRRAELWVERLDAVLSREELPFHKIGIAHLACGLINRRSREDLFEILNMIPDDEMERLFSKAAKVGCGIELNKSDMSYADSEADIILRPFRIAKSCGCKFYLGSDAHGTSALDTAKAVFERAIDHLDLTENDKFPLLFF